MKKTFYWDPACTCALIRANKIEVAMYSNDEVAIATTSWTPIPRVKIARGGRVLEIPYVLKIIKTHKKSGSTLTLETTDENASVVFF